MNQTQGVLMKKMFLFLRKTVFAASAVFAVCLCSSPLQAAEAHAQPKIAVVNFKQCVELSKLGKQEQASFEALKKQAESVLQEKEKTLTEIAAKLDDSDYLDSLAPEAEAELKHKFRNLSQEMNQDQQRLYNALSQANFKIVQKLTDEVTKASSEVAKKMGLDLVLNEESAFFFGAKLDITGEVVKMLDEKLAAGAN